MFKGEGYFGYKGHVEDRPKITDPFRQVYEIQFHPAYQGGSSFLEDESPQPAKREWKVVPITTPEQLMSGLSYLITITKLANTETLPRRFATNSPSTYLHKDTYHKDLKKMFRKYKNIHHALFKKLDAQHNEQMQSIMRKAQNDSGDFIDHFTGNDGGQTDNMIEDGLPDGGVNFY